MYNILKITIVYFLAILISNISTLEFANSQPLSMEGTSSNDKIIGREGNDNIEGFEGNDNLRGGKGNDKLYGDEGNDILKGYIGNDSLVGGEGDDKLEGGKGADSLEGGEGGDSFICDSEDVIIDFNHQDGDSIDGSCRYDYIPKQL